MNLLMHPLVTFLTAGLFLAKPGFIHQRRRLDNNMLFLCVHGEFHMQEEGERFTLRKGDAVVMRAGHEHVGWQHSAGDAPLYYWVHFTYEPPIEGCPPLVLPQFIRCPAPEKAMIIMRQLMDTNENAANHPKACDYFTTLVLMELSRQSTEGEIRSDSLIAHLLEWIRANIRRNVTLAEMSAQFNYSPEYLSRYFKRKTGVTVKNYIHARRMEMAKERLLATSMLVKEIAYEVGYSNEKHFDKVFRKSEHMTPTQYRNTFAKPHMNTH